MYVILQKNSKKILGFRRARNYIYSESEKNIMTAAFLVENQILRGENFHLVQCIPSDITQQCMP
jgi:hypothetical protein